ncbi:glycolate oxidase subunit GlcE [Cognatishimia sp. MH4019]|uniref:glycolate oxidase subunit GlcE n=1 Tax=Cognatishimia sp. MH4019 TaxID=2854030 RepID=UPI001CD585C2|nr:glycolate oxidase subunit GlcE [Cognatishimia sp. MH4019]
MTPKTEAELADAIASAKAPLRIIGGGTRPIGNPVAGEVLSTSALSGIELYEPGALTIVAKAGTPLAEIETALDKENQRLAFEPMDHRGLLGTTGAPTIGGVVAANVSGPRRIQAGACRDHMLGVRFVDGTGAILKNGGRVMKNVTGYDLVKLLTGSYGTLGVLSEVSLKVLPKTDTQATLMIHGLDFAHAVKAMSAALGSPYEVSAAAHMPDMGHGAVTMLRIEGFEKSVAYRAEQLMNELAPFGDITVESDPAKSGKIWTASRDVEGFQKADGDIWRISVKPTDGATLAAKLGTDKLFMDWGGGLIWAVMPKGTDLRAKMNGTQGHATLIRADEATRAKLDVFHPELEPIAKISAGLRAKFDPSGILNPGLMA